MTSYNHALKFFNQKKYDVAFELFDNLNCCYECGYCKFLLGDIDGAQYFWEKIKNTSPAVDWGLNLISMVQLTIPSSLKIIN